MGAEVELGTLTAAVEAVSELLSEGCGTASAGDWIGDASLHSQQDLLE